MSVELHRYLAYLVVAINDATKDEIDEELTLADLMSKDLRVPHTRREVWKQLARLLRKQLKQY